MTDLDAALANLPIAAPSLTGAHGKPAKCRRHLGWVDFCTMRCHHPTIIEVPHCHACGILKDEARSRRGRSSLQRSKREERKLARDYGGTREGWKGGPIDVATGLLAIQSKAGSTWWSKRYVAELDKLPRTGGRVPALIVSNGQPGSLVRRYVVIEERDFRSLYGDAILDGGNK